MELRLDNLASEAISKLSVPYAGSIHTRHAAMRADFDEGFLESSTLSELRVFPYDVAFPFLY